MRIEWTDTKEHIKHMNEMRFERSSPLACLELEHIEIDFGFAQLAVVLRNGNFRRQMHDSIIVANDHE